MDPRSRAAFIAGYTRILTSAWSSDEFARRLETDPVGVLAENGLPVVPGARVEIIREWSADPDLEAQVELWESGHTSRHYVLHVPGAPQIETAELAEADLDAVTGGGNTCCSCCPCCSCE